MDENHIAFQESLAAYALGALEPEEAAALETHLQTCETCRAELAGYQRVSTGLMAALPARPPRSAARRQLQRRLAGQVRHPRTGFNWSVGQWVFAGLLAALVGLNLLTGNAGQISLCHSSFMAIGAYGTALAVTRLGLPFWLAIPGAMAAAAALGSLLGLPAIRLRGIYLALATLGFLQIVQILIEEFAGLTGGVRGMSIPKPTVAGDLKLGIRHILLFGLPESKSPQAEGALGNAGAALTSLFDHLLECNAVAGGNPLVVVSAYNNPSGLSPTEWAKESTACHFDEPFHVNDVSIDGASGITCVAEAVEGMFEPTALLSQDGKIFHIGTLMNDSDFAAFLSSFRFSP